MEAASILRKDPRDFFFADRFVVVRFFMTARFANFFVLFGFLVALFLFVFFFAMKFTLAVARFRRKSAAVRWMLFRANWL
jgi:hypothetical protein